MSDNKILQAIDYLEAQKRLFPKSFNVLSGHFDTAISALQDQTEREKGCNWDFIDDDTDMAQRYKTDCGHEFSFEDGTPQENGFIVCPYCGKKLVNPNE